MNLDNDVITRLIGLDYGQALMAAFPAELPARFRPKTDIVAPCSDLVLFDQRPTDSPDATEVVTAN